MDEYKYDDTDLCVVEKLYQKFVTLPSGAQQTFLLCLKTRVDKAAEHVKNPELKGAKDIYEKTNILYNYLDEIKK